MDVIRNVLVQLGDPLVFTDIGDGLTVNTDVKGNIMLGSSVALQMRCAATRALRGSWMVRVDIVSVANALFSNFVIGAIPVPPRETLAQRRPVNTPRPQDWNMLTAGQNAIALTRDGTLWNDGNSIGALPSTPQPGDSIYVIHDAAARTLTFRLNDPHGATEVVASDVDGPLRFVANAFQTAVSLRIAHDIERLPRIEGIRPAGVWGRLATLGVMDTEADVVWDGRIAEGGDPTFELAASFAVMGNRGRTRGIGDITAINTPDLPGSEIGALDDWLVWSTRDEPITILRGEWGRDLSTYTAVARGAVDSISQPREGVLSISARDNSVLLDIPWQADVYPDTAPLASLRGRSKPTATGLVCRAAGLVQTDAANLLYDVSDDVAFVSQVYDQGVQLTLGTGYSLRPDNRSIKRLTNPVGLMCALVEGGLMDDTVCIGTTVGDFVQWSGSPSAPRGWTNPTTGAGASVTSTVDGARFVRASAGQADLLAANVLGVYAGVLRIDIDIAAHASGALQIRAETSGGAGSVLATINSTGVTGLRSITVALPASRPYLRLRAVAASTDITVRSLRVSQITTASSPLHFAKVATKYRAALPGNVSITNFTSLFAEPLCLWTGTDERRTVLQILDGIVDSIGACWWFSRSGELTLSALEAPDYSGSLVLDDGNIEGDVTSTLDSASGLSARVAGDPTWTVHGNADIAGSLNTSDAGRVFAESLKAEFAAIRVGQNRVAPEYAFANNAEPIETFLQTANGAQLLADTYTAIYRVPRRIYRCRVNLDDVLTLNPMDTAELVTSDSTRNVRVLSITGRYSSDTADLTLWG